MHDTIQEPVWTGGPRLARRHGVMLWASVLLALGCQLLLDGRGLPDRDAASAPLEQPSGATPDEGPGVTDAAGEADGAVSSSMPGGPISSSPPLDGAVGEQPTPDDSGEVVSVECREPSSSKQAGGVGFDRAESVAVSRDGSVLITGRFSGDANFGSIALRSAGMDDIFLAKYAADGSVVWAERGGGSGSDRSTSVAVLPDETTYVTGSFAGAAAFGATMLPSSNVASAFLAKYAANGALQWVRPASGEGWSEGASVAALADGSAIITGSFSGTVSLGASTFASLGESDIFIAKARPDGEFVWVRRAGGASPETSYAVAALSDGSVYIAGDFWGPSDFGGVTLTPRGGYDLFLAKYDSEGSMLWAVSAGGEGGNGYALAKSLATLDDGSVYVAGEAGRLTMFGPLALTEQGGAFLAKYAANGTPTWVRGFGSAGSTGSSVAAGPDGAAYLAGGFLEGVLLDVTTMFVAKYDAEGSFVWAQRSAGSGDATYSSNYGRSIAVRSGCVAALTGGFTNNWTFGGSSFASLGDEDVFLTRFSP